ncbi:hypothetical protein B0H16DRAFT_1466211 [Mycena metata]|uniref:Uncharacterized protein n=1 Tax=Mycena metata TaxID=1033252 RepID=A0AAD7IA15_9AGAR|nr:hypothetical protein B0H16DRAFT_1466211 [Mycena metata]
MWLLSGVNDPEVFPYYISAQGVQAWATLCASKGICDSALKHLKAVSENIDHWTFGPWGKCNPACTTFKGSNLPPDVLSAAVNNSINIIMDWLLQILLDYLLNSSSSETIPYQFGLMQALLLPPSGITMSQQTLGMVQLQLDRVVYSNLERFCNTPDELWLDQVFHRTVSYSRVYTRTVGVGLAQLRSISAAGLR